MAAASAHQFVLHPVRFFEARLPGRSGWRWSTAAIMLCIALHFLSAVIVLRKASAPAWLVPAPTSHEMLLMTIAGLSTMMTVLTTYALVLMVVACGGTLLREDLPLRPLVGWTGVAFFSQLPNGLIAVAVALAWQPDLAHHVTASDLAIGRLLPDATARTVVEAVRSMSAGWLILLCGAALKAASGASLRTIAVRVVALGAAMTALYQAAFRILTG